MNLPLIVLLLMMILSKKCKVKCLYFLFPNYNSIPLFRKIEMQESNRIKIFTKFTQTIKPLLCKEIMDALQQHYYIRQFKIWEIDTPTAINFYFGIVTKGRKTNININDKNELGWVQNQLRLFVWTLVLYAYSRNIDIKDIGDNDWYFFTVLFPNKQQILFQYQCNNLLKNHNQYKKWVHEEDKLFQELVKKDNYRLKWSDLGKMLYIESNKKYFRTPKQCRERWLNHLDPSKLKKYWLQEEDFTLIEYVKFQGKKWAAISKKLGNKRNQHSIKNRFKSLLTKQSKLTMRVTSQETLIDNIFNKLMHNQPKHQQNIHNLDNQKRDNSIADEEISFESSQDKQELPNFQCMQEQSQILGNISIILNQKLPLQEIEDKNNGNIITEKQAFQFSKLNSLMNQNQQRIWPGEQQIESEIEKRIRADLFLQQDPFQMLKTYFYKSTN